MLTLIKSNGGDVLISLPRTMASTLCRHGFQEAGQHGLGAALSKIGSDPVCLDVGDYSIAKFRVSYAPMEAQPTVRRAFIGGIVRCDRGWMRPFEFPNCIGLPPEITAEIVQVAIGSAWLSFEHIRYGRAIPARFEVLADRLQCQHSKLIPMSEQCVLPLLLQLGRTWFTRRLRSRVIGAHVDIVEERNRSGSPIGPCLGAPLVIDADLDPVPEAIRRRNQVVDPERLDFPFLFFDQPLHVTNRVNQIMAGTPRSAPRFRSLSRGLRLGVVRKIALVPMQMVGDVRARTPQI